LKETGDEGLAIATALSKAREYLISTQMKNQMLMLTDMRSFNFAGRIFFSDEYRIGRPFSFAKYSGRMVTKKSMGLRYNPIRLNFEQLSVTLFYTFTAEVIPDSGIAMDKYHVLKFFEDP